MGAKGLRRAVLCIGIAFVLAGCTNSGRPTSTTATTADTPPASEFHVADPLTPDGTSVIQQVVVGTSVDAHGTVVGVAPSFDASTGVVVAGALLTDAPVGLATVTWSVEEPDGERTVFADDVAVAPNKVLLARAEWAGSLAGGLYRVHVTVGAEARDALFLITGGNAGQASLATAANGGQLQSGGAQVEEVPEGCTPGSQLDKCWGWFDNGDSDNNPTPTTAPPCGSDAKPDVELSQDVVRLGGVISARADTTNCDPAGHLSLGAGVAGAAPAAVAQGGQRVEWTGNTCALVGHSDLFGDVVRARASVPDSTRDNTTALSLAELGPIPNLASVSPPLGSTVHAGQTIDFTAVAAAFGATQGVKSVTVSSSDGNVIARGGRPQPAAACELTLDRFMAFATGTYLVPDDAAPVVELLLRAETFDGSTASFPLRWAKKPTWSGSLAVHVDQPVPSGQQFQDYDADVVVSEQTTGVLTGSVRGLYTQELTQATCPSETTTPGTATGDLAGTIDPAGMHLQAAAGETAPPVVTPCPGTGPPGLMPSPLTFPQVAQLLADLAPKGNERYSGQVDITVSGNAPYRVRASLTLTPLDQDPVDDAAISITPARPGP